jgi:apolipoprotein N-acyltransferase
VQNGGEPQTYAKQHLIPGLEGSRRASVVVDGSSRVSRAALARPIDGKSMSLQMARPMRGVPVPAWDLEIDAWLHGRMAILRGVESGFARARHAIGSPARTSAD